MCEFALSNEDLEIFSEYLGLSGIDADLFYETYYLKDTEEAQKIMEDEFQMVGEYQWMNWSHSLCVCLEFLIYSQELPNDSTILHLVYSNSNYCYCYGGR